MIITLFQTTGALLGGNTSFIIPRLAENPDHAARRVLMSCYLYYRRATHVLPDGDYDALVEYTARNWNRLHPTRQWQLGSPDEIRASGHAAKITSLVEHAACSWHERVFGHIPGEYAIGDNEWRFDPSTDHARWVAAER